MSSLFQNIRLTQNGVFCHEYKRNYTNDYNKVTQERPIPLVAGVSYPSCDQ